MGFGYLLMGYLVSFLLKMTAGALGVGSLLLLLGYGLMWSGLRSLRMFCRSFAYAEWVLYPMVALALYHGAEDLSALLFWELPILAATQSAVAWVEFFLIMVFHAALLSAIREIAMEVDLNRIASATVRNMIILALYAVVYILYFVPGLIGDSVRGYLTLSMTLLNLAWIICDLLLLLNCTKSIAPEGQEEIEEKRYKWEFLNRVGDRFSENMKKATESNRDAIEDHLRKKQEKKQKKGKKK